MEQPNVFIIILSWNCVAEIRDCLDSVAKLDYSNFSVVVVDNASTDDSVAIIRKHYPHVTLIENLENLGFTGGNNVGLRHAMGAGADYFWLLNDDALVEPTTLSALVAEAEANPAVGLLSPVIHYYDEPEKIQFCGSYIDWETQRVPCTSELADISAWQSDEIKDICLWGTALLIRRAIIEKTGYLDDRYFAYWEDIDLSIRSVKAGYINRVVLSSRIFHKNPVTTITSTSRPPHFHYLTTRNEYLFWHSNLPSKKKARYTRKFLALAIADAEKCREYGALESLDACLAGMWDALTGHYGVRNMKRKLPGSLKRMILWRPYFLILLIDGRFGDLLRQCTSRLKFSR